MATTAAGITYEMRRISFSTTSSSFQTALDFPNADSDSFIFINQIGLRNASSNTIECELQRTSLLSDGSVGRSSKILGRFTGPLGGASSQSTPRSDFFNKPDDQGTGIDNEDGDLDKFGWRTLYPGDRIRIRRSSGASGSVDILIWYTIVKFKGQFQLL